MAGCKKHFCRNTDRDCIDERNQKMKIGIVGYGHVGTAMKELFKDAIIYDKPKNIGSQEEINDCDVVFICVPTPMGVYGECDISIIEEVLKWIDAKCIVIRSTVPVGFTERWQNIKPESSFIFQPEYYGETVNHPFSKLISREWITLGGVDCSKAVEAYQKVYTSELIINTVSSKTAELAKYMENCFLAMKVVFCNEFYDIAQKFDVDYNALRETWLLDPRIGRSHTFVYRDNRGYGGSCLPKDISAMIYQAQKNHVDVALLESVVKKMNY